MAYFENYFKVLKDNELIGVTTDQSFARYSAKSKRVHICKAIDGQYIVLNDRFYRDDWMLPLDSNDRTEYEAATVIAISEKEYEILLKSEDHESIDFKKSIDTDPAEVAVKPKKESDILTAEYVRERKLKELSSDCKTCIENGFDLVLSDGVSHHFSMTLQDQINLIGMQRSLDLNEDPVYHADGELMQFYSLEDAQDILIGANKWRNYYIALYNSLKNWINSIDDIDIIDQIKIDSEIPDQYCTAVFQNLTENF